MGKNKHLIMPVYESCINILPEKVSKCTSIQKSKLSSNQLKFLDIETA